MRLPARSAVLVALVAAGALAPACTKDSRPPSLADPLAVEQPGGAATQLLAAGSQLPTSATESFTTAQDGERRLKIHVLRGGGKKASTLESAGWWTVDGLSAAPAGQTRAMVTFELDAKGELSISAREEDRKLKVSKADARSGHLAPSPLTEPDDDDEGVDEE
jgi:molecular chaperone DnaK